MTIIGPQWSANCSPLDCVAVFALPCCASVSVCAFADTQLHIAMTKSSFWRFTLSTESIFLNAAAIKIAFSSPTGCDGLKVLVGNVEQGRFWGVAESLLFACQEKYLRMLTFLLGKLFKQFKYFAMTPQYLCYMHCFPETSSVMHQASSMNPFHLGIAPNAFQ